MRKGTYELSDSFLNDEQFEVIKIHIMKMGKHIVLQAQKYKTGFV